MIDPGAYPACSVRLHTWGRPVPAAAVGVVLEVVDERRHVGLFACVNNAGSRRWPRG
jgi:hypothetical protein